MKASLRIPLALLAFVFLSVTPARSEEEPWDPIEDVNRGIFWFNDQFDVYLLEPVAKGYDYVVPDSVQASVTNFFSNLQYPVHLLGDLVQFKFGQAAHHTGRFAINTTLGVVGLFDVAKEYGLEEHKEDFAIALAYHGVPPGPYIVLPFYGPSNLRDAVGLVVDTVADPLYWVNFSNVRQRTKNVISISTTTIKVVNKRSGLLDAVRSAKEGSVDYYLFMQAAYYQYREGLLYDGNVPEVEVIEDEQLVEKVNLEADK